VLAEVDLSDAATPVAPPDWLAPYIVREVTGEPEYLNVNLAADSGRGYSYLPEP
jgi:CYTH domain-containing protein